MLDVRPFRGVRYRIDTPTALGNLVSPPYDVISPADRERLVQGSPYNVVRIDLPTDADPPGPGADRYERAAALWREWLGSGVVVQEEKPAFYAYRQAFDPGDGKVRVRWGLMGQVRLAAYGEGIVYPHERTLSGPREDRLRLQRATKLNLSPVYGLHFGAKESMDSLLESLCQGEPAGHVVDADGVDHRLWVLSDEEQCRRIQGALSPARIVIADGHHRYETALAYRDERRAAGGGGGTEAGWNFVLMVLTDLDSPELVVLPTHRILRNLGGFSTDQLLQRLEEDFHLEPVDAGIRTDTGWAQALEALGDGRGFGLYGGPGKAWIARAKAPGALMARLAPSRSEAWRRLEVALLHTAVVEGVLGLDADAQASGKYLEYTRVAQEALDAVDSGHGQFAFLLRPNTPGEVRDVALAGDSMPQKSTYFYPKLLTGLVFCDLEAPAAPRLAPEG